MGVSIRTTPNSGFSLNPKIYIKTDDPAGTSRIVAIVIERLENGSYEVIKRWNAQFIDHTERYWECPTLDIGYMYKISVINMGATENYIWYSGAIETGGWHFKATVSNNWAMINIANYINGCGKNLFEYKWNNKGSMTPEPYKYLTADGYLNYGSWASARIGNLLPDTEYTVEIRGWLNGRGNTVSKFYTIKTLPNNNPGPEEVIDDPNITANGTPPSSNQGDVGVGPDGTSGYDKGIKDNIGPYPIDDTTYTGQQGTQRGVSWKATSTHGYFWAKIQGTGHKLIDNNINNRYTGTYDGNHHGTGDYAYIDLEGDCAFSCCSWCQWTVSALMTTDNNWGVWDPVDPSALHNASWRSDWWYPAIHWVGSGRSWSTVESGVDLSNGLIKRLNTWRDGNYKYYNAGPDGGYYNDHATWGGGRGSAATEPIARELNSKIVSYYCLQNMNDCGYDGSSWQARRGYGSVAAIQFIVPRLDPLVKVVSSNSNYGSVYFQVATEQNVNTGEYNYDSTHYTERYIPIGTHIKIIAIPTDVGKFINYTNDISDDTSSELTYELDIMETLVLDSESITFTANFELGQFEIKVEKGNDIITSVSKTPSHSEGLAENWYLPNTEITIDAELKPSSDVAYYTFDSWKIGDEVVFNNKRNTFRANRSGTYTAYGKASNLKYKVIYSPWECSASIKNEVSGAIGDSVLAELGERLTLSCTPTDNYIFKGWKQRLDENHDWEDLNSTSIIAGNYHYFMPVLVPDGAECSILSPDEFNAIAQPIYQKSFKDYSKLVGVNQRWMGMKDPNSINWEEIKEQGLTWDKEPELGDFFFMKKGGE